MRKIKKLLKKRKEAKEAISKIKEYFDAASTSFPKSRKTANDYVRKARNLSMKYKIKIPISLKRRFCKNCYSYLVPGINLRIRLHGRNVIYYCLECKRFMRFPYHDKK